MAPVNPSSRFTHEITVKIDLQERLSNEEAREISQAALTAALAKLREKGKWPLLENIDTHYQITEEWHKRMRQP